MIEGVQRVYEYRILSGACGSIVVGGADGLRSAAMYGRGGGDCCVCTYLGFKPNLYKFRNVTLW